jgi:hypothetical protein
MVAGLANNSANKTGKKSTKKMGIENSELQQRCGVVSVCVPPSFSNFGALFDCSCQWALGALHLLAHLCADAGPAQQDIIAHIGKHVQLWTV